MAGTGGGGCGTARGGHEPLRWLSAVEALLPNASQPAPRPPTGIRADKVKAQQAAQVAKKSERRLMVPDGGAACRCNKRTRTNDMDNDHENNAVNQREEQPTSSSQQHERTTASTARVPLKLQN